MHAALWRGYRRTHFSLAHWLQGAALQSPSAPRQPDTLTLKVQRMLSRKRSFFRTSVLLVGSFILALGAQAAQPAYLFLKAVPSLKPVGGNPKPADPTVDLASGLLPDGSEGKPYSFDLKALTTTTGGQANNAVQYSLSIGSLPTGVTLSSEGMLAGVPTTATQPEGAAFTVQATYLTANGQRAYTIKIGEAVLQAVQVVAGGSYVCALTPGGAVKCWGSNAFGVLGRVNSGRDVLMNSSVPLQIPGLDSGVTLLASGSKAEHVCVVHFGTTKCWGRGVSGQLGNGVYRDSVTPVAVQGLGTGVSAISMSTDVTCAVDSGSAKCWGGNSGGILGDGTSTNSAVPVQVVGVATGASAVEVGIEHACAIQSGSVKCWGSNSYGTLGDGTGNDSMTPVLVSGLSSGVSSISSGMEHVCAIVNSQAVCWGKGLVGRLGNGDEAHRFSPTPVVGLPGPTTAISAASTHTCALSAGGAYCWGENSFGKLGNGVETPSALPVAVTGLGQGVSLISAGFLTTCAIQAGNVKCWGSASEGKIGNGKLTTQRTPVNVKVGS